MSAFARLAAAFLALAVAVPVLGPPAPARADTDSVATTTLGDLVRVDLAGGAPGLIGATATQSFTGTPAPDQFIGAATLADPALEDAWLLGGELGAWLAPEHPEPAGALLPSLGLTESLTFETTYGSGPVLSAGDEAGFNTVLVPYNAPLPWDHPRGEATGQLTWSAVSLIQETGSTFGGSAGDLETFTFRADIKAIGGDVDARDSSVHLPPLVLDLPRDYDPSVRYAGMAGVVSPYTTYFADFSMVALPQAGKLVLRAEISGYIPESTSTELPNGATINKWSLPLTGVVGFSTSGASEPTTSMTLPLGGVTTSLNGIRTALDAGETLIATTDAADTVPADPGVTQAASLVTGDLATAAAIDRSITEPVPLHLGSGFGLTIHPDYGGEGILALEGVRSDRLKRRYADLVAVPAVRVGPERTTEPLTRDRLIGLRATPFRNGGGVRIGLNARFAEGGLNQSVTTSTKIYKGGFLLEALYEIPGGILVTVEHQLFHQGVPNGGRLNTNVRAIARDGRTIEVLPVAAARLEGSNQITVGGEPMSAEGSFPSTRMLAVGDQRIDATFRAGFGTQRAGTTTVLSQPAPLSGRVPDPAIQLADAPLALTIEPPAIPMRARFNLTTFRFGLIKGAPPQASPPEPGVACHGVHVEDVSGPDAPPSHDVSATWFEADLSDLYVTTRVRDLLAPGSSLPARFTTSFSFDHERFLVEALLQGGSWVFQGGLASVSWRVPLDGIAVPGPDGYVRIALPLEFIDLAEGDWIRDAVTESFAAGTRGIDRAPQPALALSSSSDYQVAPCIEEPDIVDTVLTLVDPAPVQYSDEFMVTGILTDDQGGPLGGLPIRIDLGDSEKVTESALDGTFEITALADRTPGTYPVTASFAGTDGLAPSNAEATYEVTHEDATLALAVAGQGSKRVLQATLYDPDSLGAIAGRTLDFYADGVFLGSAVTDEAGSVIFEPPARYRGGHHLYEAIFAGDTYYLQAAASVES